MLRHMFPALPLILAATGCQFGEHPTSVIGQPGMSVSIVGDPGTIANTFKVSALSGGPAVPPIAAGDQFGRSSVSLGDLNGDGVVDFAVSSLLADQAGFNTGSVWILQMNADFTVDTVLQEITEGSGGFQGDLDPNDVFGASIANLGDMDQDGVPEIVVSAPQDDDGGTENGAVYVLFLDSVGGVKSQAKISETANGNAPGGFGGTIADNDEFGTSVAAVGDINLDGVVDLAVGAQGDDTGGNATGAVWLLMLDSIGSVQEWTKIDYNSFSDMGVGNAFGNSVAAVGDWDQDGVPDLAVGAPLDDDGGFDSGAIWMLLLRTDGSIKRSFKISRTEGNFIGALADEDYFRPIGAIGDLNLDGHPDLLASASGDNDGGNEAGAVWILFMQDSTVLAEEKLSGTSPGLQGLLDPNDLFGIQGATPGDLDGDGIPDIVVGAALDDDGAANSGALYFILLHGFTTMDLVQAILDAVVENLGLGQGQENALVTKLEKVLEEIQGEDASVAAQILQAFINQMEGLINGDSISEEEGRPIIEAAESVLQNLSGESE